MEEILTPEQKDRLVQIFEEAKINFEDVDLLTVTREIFQNDLLTGKTKEGRAIKKFCEEKGYSFSVRKVVLKGLIELTEEQKKIISNKFRVTKLLDLTREVFGDDKLTNLSQQFRTVKDYVENLQKELSGEPTIHIKEVGYEGSEKLVDEEYRPPRTVKQTIDKVNEYLQYDWTEEGLKKRELLMMVQLKKYLNTYKFIYQMSTYKRISLQKLFEDSFIRYTHDKPDLTQEELDQYITLCDQTVRIADIQKRIELFRVVEEADGVSQKMAETIKTLETSRNDCEKLKKTLYDSLTKKRKDRLEEITDNSEKLSNLFLLWKNEEERKAMIRLAQLEEEKVKDEANKIMSMSHLKAALRGATIEELSTGPDL